jgi:ribonuclease P protein component
MLKIAYNYDEPRCEGEVQKEYRLSRKEDFSSVYRAGKSVANHQFALYYKKNPSGIHFRLGISASKKVGGAVVRNRIRRQLKEIFRLHADEIKEGYDLIIIVRKGAIDMEYEALVKSVKHVLRKAELSKKIRSVERRSP